MSNDRFCIEVMLQLFEGIPIDALGLGGNAHVIVEQMTKLIGRGIVILPGLGYREVEAQALTDHAIDLLRETVDLDLEVLYGLGLSLLIDKETAVIHLKTGPCRDLDKP
jgi:hypothetical protein